jgi:hypothetical protein
MGHGDRSVSLLKLVNLARATYGVFELETLPMGQLQSAPFCPIGRSLRRGVEDWLFVAVGTTHLRLWALGRDSVAIAKQIMTAWEVPDRKLKQSAEQSGFVIFPLPSEMRNFVEQFDRGLLPDHRGQVDQQEVRHLRELANGMPIPGRQRNGAHSIRDL